MSPAAWTLALILLIAFVFGMAFERYLRRRKLKREAKEYSAMVTRELNQVAANITAKYGGEPHRADTTPIRKPK